MDTVMSQVKKCNVATCSYNRENICHTIGIMVGPHAECSSFNHGSRKCGFNDVKGGVGSCLASDCRYNDALECRAPNIDVDNHSEHADCKTFQERM